MLICLSTNGLNLPPYLDDLAEIGTSHVTLTVNAVNPEIGRHFYTWVRDNKVVYRGHQAAELLLERQLESIRGLKERGIIVKVNTIIVPWMNDQHSVEVAERLSHMGVDLHNCMPMYPNPGTLFEHIPEPSPELINLIREECENHIPQMRHCARCRSDAVGLLGQDRSEEFSSCLVACSKKAVNQQDRERPYVAVATQEGALVNEHLGRASQLYIYKQNEDNFELMEMRKAPEPGNGGKRWFELAESLKDCQAILVSAVGETPRTILEEEGLRVIEMYGLIEDGLDAAFSGKEVKGFQKRRMSCSAGACTGGGGGCG
jgi:nitrogen fixation protein NifB